MNNIHQSVPYVHCPSSCNTQQNPSFKFDHHVQRPVIPYTWPYFFLSNGEDSMIRNHAFGMTISCTLTVTGIMAFMIKLQDRGAYMYIYIYIYI